VATAEHRLLTRIIQNGEMKEALKYGISEDDFMTLQLQGIWKNLYAYYKHNSTRGSVPAEDAFRQTYSHFEFVPAPGMTTEALCHDVRQARLTIRVKEAAEAAVAAAETDPLEAAIALRQCADSIILCGSNKNSDVMLSTQMAVLMDLYEQKEAGLIKPIAQWPWGPLAEETGGVIDEDYILFYGRPKSMKTFVLTYVMAMFYEQGKRVLCYTKEMTPNNMLLRTASCLGRLPYREARLAKLSPYHRATMKNLVEDVATFAADTNGRNNLIVLSGQDAQGHDGVVWLQSKIQQYKPDVCFVDGLYLLNDDNGSKKTADWQRVMHISRDVRQMILAEHVPIIATMQANRQAAKNQSAELDEIAYSDAVGQDITQAFRVVNEKHTPTIALIAAGAREYQMHGLRINGVPCTDFSFHSIMTEKEIGKAERDDATQDEPDSAEAHAKPRTKTQLTSQSKKLDKHIEEQLDAL
jgi:hypothetical protein